jgi:hypothetical protein
MNKTLEFMVNRYLINLNQSSPVYTNRSREWEFPRLFKALGFTVGAEIGVAEGCFSEMLLKGVPNLRLFEIDAWKEYEGYEDYHEKRLLQEYVNARERLAPYNAHFVRDFSMNAVKRFKDESLDFVYIDAAHDYNHAWEDVREWSKKVKRGGIVFGHDYDIRKKYGVLEAVNEWVLQQKIHPLIIFKKNSVKSWLYVK